MGNRSGACREPARSAGRVDTATNLMPRGIGGPAHGLARHPSTTGVRGNRASTTPPLSRRAHPSIVAIVRQPGRTGRLFGPMVGAAYCRRRTLEVWPHPHHRPLPHRGCSRVGRTTSLSSEAGPGDVWERRSGRGVRARSPPSESAPACEPSRSARGGREAKPTIGAVALRTLTGSQHACVAARAGALFVGGTGPSHGRAGS